MKKINGFITAPFTPLNEDFSLNLGLIKIYAELVKRNGMDGVFVCGTSGEGYSLTTEERKAILEEWLKYADKDFKVIAHVGATGIADSIKLAQHAEKVRAWGIGVVNPVFFKPKNIDALVDYCANIASAAKELPMFFYHIPAFTGDSYSMVKFLEKANGKIPNLAGIKYTHGDLFEFNQCMKVADGKYEMLHGLDETLLYGLQTGAKSGIGGTFNQCFPLYRELIKAFSVGNIVKATEFQDKSQEFINVLIKYGGNITAGKRMMKFIGVDCGPNRLPVKSLTGQEEANMKKDLEKIGFFSYCNK